MSLIFQNPDPSRKSPGTPVRWRLLAILIMVAGAVAFAIALLFFEQQAGCLALSTLITLGGLGLNITARRKGWISSDGTTSAGPSRSSGSILTKRSRAPRGLRVPAKSTVPVQKPIAAQPSLEKRTAAPEQLPSPLMGQVISILEAQGAVVTIEAEREARCILQITTAQGQRYIVMVLANDLPISEKDVRSLKALIQGTGSSRGYLIASSGFTKGAYAWAENRSQIRLVGEDELDELGI